MTPLQGIKISRPLLLKGVKSRMLVGLQIRFASKIFYFFWQLILINGPLNVSKMVCAQDSVVKNASFLSASCSQLAAPMSSRLGEK